MQELRQADAFVDDLAGRSAASQADLTELLERLVPPSMAYEPRARAAFPDSGPFARSDEQSFREDDDYVVDAVLDRDIAAWEAAKRRGDGSMVSFVVPVPQRHTRPDTRLGQFLRTAPDARYCQFLGFWEEDTTDA